MSDHVCTHHLPRLCGASHIDTFWMDSPFSQELQVWVLQRLDTSRHPTVDVDGHLFAFFLKKYGFVSQRLPSFSLFLF
jgi:hypothetical protein